MEGARQVRSLGARARSIEEALALGPALLERARADDRVVEHAAREFDALGVELTRKLTLRRDGAHLRRAVDGACRAHGERRRRDLTLDLAVHVDGAR